MIKEWLNEYKPKNNQEAKQALREIIQEIALFGLQQSGFFEVAAFYGGTALRIFHGLPRFSEDLEFSLLSPVENFSLQPYSNGMVEQLKALGIDGTGKEKIKSQQSNVDSAFLKTNTEWKELVLKDVIPQEKLGMRPEIKIKLEVDTYPPKAFVTEQKLLLKPASFYVSIFTLPDLFAGKMHALLFRKWKNRVKGRDWFDLEWYIRKNIPLHLKHLEIRSRDSGSWAGNKLTEKELMKMLHNRIDETSIDLVKKDVLPFVPDAKPPDIWSEKYFHDLVDKMRIE
jgi:predicted nucleotidyltransferase component of viral defense system